MQDNSIIIINSLASKANEIVRNTVIGKASEAWYRMALGSTIAPTADDLQLIKNCECMPFSKYYPLTKVPNNVILKTASGIKIGFFNCKINVTKSNTIVKTALVGAKGTVKEFIQALDYSVQITGDLIAPKGEFPISQLSVLNHVLSESESLLVSSVYLESVFGISKLMVDKALFNQASMKSLNVMPFDIYCTSDEDYKLED